MLAGLATALPARVGLINVGGEGQLHIGAWLATGVALFASGGPWVVTIPFHDSRGFCRWSVHGPAWLSCSGTGAALTRSFQRFLLNFVAILLVNVFVFGPWKNPDGFGYPYTANFDPTAILPAIGGTRFHWGFVLPVIAVIVVYFVIAKTRWGYNIRAIGGNPDAAERRGIPVGRYLMAAMLVGGGIAGIAGMIEVSGVQHHLRPEISNNLGFLGFLASWLARHNPIALIGASFLLALVVVGGDLLQFSADVPSGASNILIALILFMVLGFGQRSAARQ